MNKEVAGCASRVRACTQQTTTADEVEAGGGSETAERPALTERSTPDAVQDRLQDARNGAQRAMTR